MRISDWSSDVCSSDLDISEPTSPCEVGYFVPPRNGDIDDYMSWRRGTTEAVFIEWDRKLIWITTHSGLYCLSAKALGEPVVEAVAVDLWSVPHINRGWDGASSLHDSEICCRFDRQSVV